MLRNEFKDTGRMEFEWQIMDAVANSLGVKDLK